MAMAGFPTLLRGSHGIGLLMSISLKKGEFHECISWRVGFGDRVSF